MKNLLLALLAIPALSFANIQIDTDMDMVKFNNVSIDGVPVLALSSFENAENDREFFLKQQRASTLCEMLGLPGEYVGLDITFVTSNTAMYSLTSEDNFVSKYQKRGTVRGDGTYNIAKVKSLTCRGAEALSRELPELRHMDFQSVLMASQGAEKITKLKYFGTPFLAASAFENAAHQEDLMTAERAHNVCRNFGFETYLAVSKSWNKSYGHAVDMDLTGNFLENQYNIARMKEPTDSTYYWAQISSLYCK
jgi:hypothetical protein